MPTPIEDALGTIHGTYRDKETQETYIAIAMAVDKTSSLPNSHLSVIYHPADDEHSLYVKELDDFTQVFERI
jgi:hypothetical protein